MTNDHKGEGRAKPDHYDLPLVVIGHWSRSRAERGEFEGARSPLIRAVAGAMGKEGKPPTRSRLPRSRGIGGVGVQGCPLPRLTK